MRRASLITLATFWLLLASGLSACVDPGEYRCVSDSECDSDDGRGVCEPADPSRPPGEDNRGWCAFSDSDCKSGRRYGELAGERADECVTCGGLGQPCCGKNSCDANLGCVGSICSCVTEIAYSYNHSCARKGDGTVWCWGGGRIELYGTPVDLNNLKFGAKALEPVMVPGISGVDRVVTSHDHVCALAGGSVWCWGVNWSGQLGEAATTDTHLPVQIPSLSNVVDIAVTSEGTCAVAESGEVLCWGHICANSQLPPQPIPVEVLGLPSAAKRIAATRDQVCALLDDGSVWCWTGDGGCSLTVTTGPNQPEKRSLPSSVIALEGASAGVGNYFCARLADDSTYCWGTDSAGVFTDQPGTEQASPVAAPRFDDVLDFGLSSTHACGRFSDYRVRCWGQNKLGQLGDGTTEPHASPELVKWPAFASRVGAGVEYSCMISTGRVWCWGKNDEAQLGDGTTVQRVSPVETHFSCPK